LPKRKRTTQQRSRLQQVALTCIATLLAIAILGMGAMSVRAAGASGKGGEVDVLIPMIIGTAIPLALLVVGWVKLRQRMGIAAIALAFAFTANVVFLAGTIPAEGVTDNTSTFALARTSNFATPNQDMKQNYTPS